MTTPLPTLRTRSVAALLLAFAVGCGAASDEEPPVVGPPDDSGEVDSDGDGLSDDIERQIGSSTLQVDTDGDGFSDYDEVVDKRFDPENDQYKFNPRIADLPLLSVEISDTPRIHFVYETREGETESIERGRTSDRGWSTSSSYSNTVSASVEARVTTEVSAGVQGGMPTATSSVSASLAVTAETSFQWGGSTTRENRESLSRMRTNGRSVDKTTNGGEIMITVKLHNRGNVSAVVKTLRLVAQKFTPERPNEPVTIAQLELDSNRTFDAISVVKPRSSVGPLVFKAAVNMSQMEMLLAEGRLVVKMADSVLEKDEDYENVQANTALVVIDRGPSLDGREGSTESHLVSVHSEGRRGITLREVLSDVLHVDYEVGTTPWKYGERSGTTRPGLIRVGDLANSAEDNGHWIVSHTRPRGKREETVDYNALLEEYDFDEIVLRSGHLLQLTYVRDRDRDGVGHRTELGLGTDPLSADTDGDGLSDLEEIRGWRLRTGAAELGPEVAVRSDPTLADSDFDGRDDAEERRLRTLPMTADTDGDGLDDGDDSLPLSSSKPYAVTYWPAEVDRSRNASPRSAAPDARGNVFIGGTVAGSPNWAGFVVKYSADRKRIWSRTLSNTTRTEVDFVASGEGGEVYVAGRSGASLADDEKPVERRPHVFVACYGPAGERRWLHEFPVLPAVGIGFPSVRLAGLTVAANRVTVVGNTLNLEFGQAQTFLRRYDTEGNVLVERALFEDVQRPVAAITTNAAGRVFGIDDATWPRRATDQPWTVFALDDEGALAWKRELAVGGTKGAGVVHSPTGDLFAIGGVHTDRDAVRLARLAAVDGNPIFEQTPVEKANRTPMALAVDSAGTLFVTGTASVYVPPGRPGPDYSGAEAYVAAIDQEGRTLWKTVLSVFGKPSLHSMTMTKDGHLLVIGDRINQKGEGASRQFFVAELAPAN